MSLTIKQKIGFVVFAILIFTITVIGLGILNSKNTDEVRKQVKYMNRSILSIE